MATFRIFRGARAGANGGGSSGEFRDYTTAVGEGLVVLDAVHQIQA